MRSVVVLPDPLGPRKPVMVPAGAVKDMSRTAVTRPKVFVSPRATTSVIRHQSPVMNDSS
jgi:hypothetical protein